VSRGMIQLALIQANKQFKGSKHYKSSPIASAGWRRTFLKKHIYIQKVVDSMLIPRGLCPEVVHLLRQRIGMMKSCRVQLSCFIFNSVFNPGDDRICGVLLPGHIIRTDSTFTFLELPKPRCTLVLLAPKEPPVETVL
jgi:hypothetical protein